MKRRSSHIGNLLVLVAIFLVVAGTCFGVDGNARQAELEPALQAIYPDKDAGPLLGEWLHVDGQGIISVRRNRVRYAEITPRIQADGTLCSTPAAVQTTGTKPTFQRTADGTVFSWSNKTQHGQGLSAWFYLGKITPEVKAIRLQWDVRATQVASAPEGAISFYLDMGAALDKGVPIDSIAADLPEWTTKEAKVDVESGTGRLCLQAVFLKCAGKFEIKNMTVTGL